MNYFDLNIVFIYNENMRSFIYQKKVNGKTSFSVDKDKSIIFFSQYKLINIEIIMSKTSIGIDNKPIRKNMTFIRIGIKSLSS